MQAAGRDERTCDTYLFTSPDCTRNDLSLSNLATRVAWTVTLQTNGAYTIHTQARQHGLRA